MLWVSRFEDIERRAMDNHLFTQMWEKYHEKTIFRPLGTCGVTRFRINDSYLVDPASSHMLVSKI